MKISGISIVLVTCSGLWAAYQPSVSDSLTTIDSSKWNQNGSLSAGPDGVTGNGSLISSVPVSTGSDYDIRMTIHTAKPGACKESYSLYARATLDAATGYVLKITDGNVGLYRVVSNSWTLLTWMPYYCSDHCCPN